MAKLRQVPSGLNPALDGFLRDLRDAVSLGIPQSTIKEIMTQAASVATETVINNQTTIETYIGDMVKKVVDSVTSDPNYIALGEKIDVINGPESLPASVRGQLVTLNGQLQAGIDANGSAIVTLQNTTATQAVQIAGLGTRVGNAESTIVTLNATTADQATQLTTLNTTVGNNSASIQTLQSTTNGLSAQYSVKLDVNGYVTGYGLYNQGSSSQFYIRADKFAIGSPGYTNIVPFTVLSSWQGTSPPGIYVSGDAFIDGTLYAKKIVAGNITSLQLGNGSATQMVSNAGSVSLSSQTTNLSGVSCSPPSGGRNAGGNGKVTVTAVGTLYSSAGSAKVWGFAIVDTYGNPVSSTSVANVYVGTAITSSAGICFAVSATVYIGDTETKGFMLQASCSTALGGSNSITYTISAVESYK